MSILASEISSRLVNLGQGWCAVRKAGLQAGAGVTFIAMDVCLIARSLFHVIENEPMIYPDYSLFWSISKDPLQFSRCAGPHFTKMRDAWKAARSHFQEAWSPTPPTLSQRIKMCFCP